MKNNTYILSGGFIRKAKDEGKSFCSSIVGEKRNITMLECMFAEEETKWNENLKKDKILFNKFFPDTKIEFILAEKKNFAEQIKTADVVFFKGGNPKRLIDELSEDLSWINSLEGKTVAATSAGVYALSSHYLDRTNPEPKISKGLSILPIKSIVHYGSNFHLEGPKSEKENNLFWKNATNLMQKFKSDKYLNFVKIKESEYIIYNPKLKIVEKTR